MRRNWFGTSFGLGCLVLAGVAGAQETSPAPDAGQAPSTAPAAADNVGQTRAEDEASVEANPGGAMLPDPPLAHPPESPSTSAARASCVVGEHAGVPDADARTATSIVCGELATRNPKPGRTYRVGLGKLGSVIILSLSEELEDGTVMAHRQINLSGIEEVPVATPRLVEALLEDKPVRETETVENLVGEDTRPLRKRSGESAFALGVVGLFADTEGLNTSVGADMVLGYEAPAVAIGFNLRFAAISSGEGVGMFATGPFGRYFLAKTDVSPFVGGGIGPMLLRLETDELHAQRWGLAFWADAGVELMRTHQSQLVVAARLDVPTFAVSSETNSGFILPVEIVASFVFD